MAKGEEHQQYEVFSRWCGNQVQKLTQFIGRDEGENARDHDGPRPAVVELCQRLAQIGLGSVLDDIPLDSKITARQAVALLSRWRDDLAERYDAAEAEKRQREAAVKDKPTKAPPKLTTGPITRTQLSLLTRIAKSTLKNNGKALPALSGRTPKQEPIYDYQQARQAISKRWESAYLLPDTYQEAMDVLSKMSK